MAYEIIETDGEVLRVRILGLMRVADQRALETVALDLIERGKRPRLLVITENFQGWEKGEGWDDAGFLMDYGNKIVKIGIVGDERWKEQALLFTGKGLRVTEIEFFPPSSLHEAELWVRS